MKLTITAGPLAFRPANEADIEAIALLWCRAWPDEYGGRPPEAMLPYRRLDDFRRMVPGRVADTTVAVLEGRLAGFVTIEEDEVEQLYVAKEARGGTTATALLARAEEAIAEGFAAAWLAVVPGNARARRCYERNGWQDKGGIEYAAPTPDGRTVVACRRYEKALEKALGACS